MWKTHSFNKTVTYKNINLASSIKIALNLTKAEAVLSNKMYKIEDFKMTKKLNLDSHFNSFKSIKQPFEQTILIKNPGSNQISPPSILQIMEKYAKPGSVGDLVTFHNVPKNNDVYSQETVSSLLRHNHYKKDFIIDGEEVSILATKQAPKKSSTKFLFYAILRLTKSYN